MQTYAFLAPEQKRMKIATASADAYAFGVLIYYLITGDFAEGLYRPIREQVRLYQYDWDTVLKQCLSMSVDDRPLKLLPLLGLKVGSAVTTAEIVQQAPLKESVQVQKEHTAPMEIAAKLPQPQEEQQFEETLETELVAVAAAPVAAKVAAPSAAASVRFKPIIQRQDLPTPTGSASASAVTMELMPKRDLMEATASVMTPGLSDLPQRKTVEELLNKEPIVKQYLPEQGPLQSQEPIPTEMVIVPGGRYMRGSSEGNRDESPEHLIEIKVLL